ncbi:hypothetical protein DPMN_167104 [Dreissena polymorpha]|uniref:Uncharacterized protein n=1 Tax=Dreissena polymorpha TaxID=45954 RepID=A0A9D4F3A1_DREPO|nr:hypothetical protein DPMN_167104 [Dreissena polymorpha]
MVHTSLCMTDLLLQHYIQVSFCFIWCRACVVSLTIFAFACPRSYEGSSRSSSPSNGLLPRCHEAELPPPAECLSRVLRDFQKPSDWDLRAGNVRCKEGELGTTGRIADVIPIHQFTRKTMRLISIVGRIRAQ